MRRGDWLFPEPFPEEEPAIPGKIRLRRGFLTETAVPPHSCLLPETRVFLGKAQALRAFVSRTERAKRP